MKKLFIFFAVLGAVACSNNSTFNAESVADAQSQITRVEPLSWWTGMKTPLQLLINGENISQYNVALEGGRGVEITAIHKADSPNYLFVDVAVAENAAAGTYYLVFTNGDEQFKYPYTIAERRKGSAERESFTTADAIYLLMPDRFGNGDPENDSTPCTTEKADRKAFFGRHGGDLQGMINGLDYIASLGATTIWPTPLLLDNEPHESYHGYACGDYYHIDPRFGSNELYKEFVAQAHERDLKVIMDVVTNHCGVSHWWMKDQPFNDWVHNFPTYTGTNVCFSTNMDPNASAYDLNLQESGWFVPSMPDMNLNNEYVLNYFKQWAVWWIEYADLDGFRVDTYPYNEKNPMSEWCKSVMAEYPNINIVGECWTSSIPQLAYWQGGNANKDGFNSNLRAVMDFPLQEAICHALSTDNPGWGQGMTRVYDCLSHDFVYHDLDNMMIFTNNHDTTRIGDVINKNPGRAKIGLAMLATMRGIPQIFYGEEMMLCSADLSQGHGGLRIDFPGGWAGDKTNLLTAEGRKGQNKELFDFSARLFNWRKSKEVIHTGNTMHFMTRDNTYAYFRYNDTDAVFVYVNNTDKPKNIPWSNYAEIGSSLKDGRCVLSGEEVVIDNNTKVAPYSVIVVEYKR